MFRLKTIAALRNYLVPPTSTSRRHHNRRSLLRMAVEELESRQLLSAGGLDTTFGGSGKTVVPFDLGGRNDDLVGDMAIQENGWAVVVGQVINGNSTPENFDFGIIRLNASGMLDGGFGVNGKLVIAFDQGSLNFDQATAVAIQADGKIVVAGNVNSSSSDVNDTDIAIVRLHPNGEPDISFGAQGRVIVPINLGMPLRDTAADLLIQPDGRIVVVGSAYNSASPSDTDFLVLRLNANGSLDNSFGEGGRRLIGFDPGRSDFANAVALQTDGDILVAGTIARGTIGNSDMAVVRLDGNGSLDTTFGIGGRQIIAPNVAHRLRDRANAIAVQDDGKIVLGGDVEIELERFAFAAVRLLQNGALDPAYGQAGEQRLLFNEPGANQHVSSLALQPDGRLVLAGSVIDSITPGFDFGVMRLDEDGQLDASFGDAGRMRIAFDLGRGNYDNGIAVGLQPDGDVLVAGNVDNVGSTDFGVAALQGRTTYLVAGVDAGEQPRVRVWDADSRQLRFDFDAFNPAFDGGVRVATADLTGDGVTDIAVAAGPGGGPHVRVFDGRTGNQITGTLGSFYAYDAAFTGGLFVAAGDINGDRWPDLVTGADMGGGPHVKGFDGKTGGLLTSFFAYASSFTGGVRVAVGNVDGMQSGEIVTGAGPGGGPHLRVFDALTGMQLPGAVGSQYAYAPDFSGGLYVAASDLDGDGRYDIVTGAGAGGGPHVRVFSGFDGAQLASFYAGPTEFLGGVRIASSDLPFRRQPTLVIAGGMGAPPQLHVYWFDTREQIGCLMAFEEKIRNGLFVAGGIDIESARLLPDCDISALLAGEEPPDDLKSSLWLEQAADQLTDALFDVIA